MVITTMQQSGLYEALHPQFARVFAVLREMAEKPCTAGKYAIAGEKFYINALAYDTKAEADAMMEAHRQYIDVMLLVEGEEQILTAPVDEKTVFTKAYDAEADFGLMPIPANSSSAYMLPGSVCILFPSDGHAPGILVSQSKHVRKLIAKVPMDAMA